MTKRFAIYQDCGQGSVKVFFEDKYFHTEEEAEEYLVGKLDQTSELYTYLILKVYQQLTPIKVEVPQTD